MGESIVWKCGGVVLWGYYVQCFFREIVPAVSSKGVCLETPTALTTAEKC